MLSWTVEHQASTNINLLLCTIYGALVYFHEVGIQWHNDLGDWAMGRLGPQLLHNI